LALKIWILREIISFSFSFFFESDSGKTGSGFFSKCIRKENFNPDNALELRYESLKYNKSAPYFQEAKQSYGLRK